MATSKTTKTKTKPDQLKLSTTLNYCDELIYNIHSKWNELIIPKKYRTLISDACDELGRFSYSEGTDGELVCQRRDTSKEAQYDQVTKISANNLGMVGLKSESKQLKLKLTVVKDLKDFFENSGGIEALMDLISGLLEIIRSLAGSELFERIREVMEFIMKTMKFMLRGN